MTAETTALPVTKPQKESLGDIFASFYKDAVTRFPALAGLLLIADINQVNSYGVKEIDHRKTGLPTDAAFEYLNNHPITTRLHENEKESSCASYDPDRNLRIIFINDRFDKKEWDNVSETSKKNLLYLLDHELAHLAIADGYPFDTLSSRVISESIADAYALIRHYQRFGADSNHEHEFINPWERGNLFIRYQDNVHFTTFVLDEIIRRKHLIDFNGLSPQHTASLAWRFAMEYAPPAPVVVMLSQAFNKVAPAYNSSREEGRRAWVDVTLDPKTGYYTFKLGSRMLHGLLNDKAQDNAGKIIRLRGKYWDDVRHRLKEREFKFAQEEILFNMPKAATAPRLAPARKNCRIEPQDQR